MRVTRAALRAQAPEDTPLIHEDADSTQELDTSQSSEDVRPALKDITDEALANKEAAVDYEENVPAKKMRGRQKTKTTKTDTAEQEIHVEATRTQLGGEHTMNRHDETSNINVTPNPTATDMAQGTITDPSVCASPIANQPKVLQTPSKDLATTAKTPKFDPELHLPLSQPEVSDISTADDSFVESIKSRSPSKMNLGTPVQDASQDSFIEHIRTRTPMSRSPRIEDSVDAIDALEDALEKVSENLPAIDQLYMDSPVKAPVKTPAKSLPPSARKTAVTTVIASKTPKSVKVSPTKTPNPIKVSPTKTSKPVKVSPIKTSNPIKVSPAKSSATALRPAPPKTKSGRISTVKPTVRAPIINKSQSRLSTIVTKTEPAQPTLSFSASPVKQQSNVVKKRVPSAVLSTSKPGFVPAKSSKPVTKSSFTLPGEAIAAKLKAQREERMQKEEEAEQKKEFKARPAPPRISRLSVVPRATKTSSARLSLMTNTSDKENTAPPEPVISSTARPSTAALTVMKIRPDLHKANTSIQRNNAGMEKKPVNAAAPRSSVAPRVISLSTGQRLAVTKEDAVHQKARGKEVFGRNKAEMDKLAQDRKEKEDAAKKARLEAAERGRQASREWAEKQKLKKLATSNSKGTTIAA